MLRRVPLALGAALAAALLAGCTGSPTPDAPGSSGTPGEEAPVAQACPDDLANLYAAAGFTATLADVATFALPAGAVLAETPTCVVTTPGLQSAYFVGAGDALVTELGTALASAGYLASAGNTPTFVVWHSVNAADVTASAFTNARAEGELSGIVGPVVVVAVG